MSSNAFLFTMVVLLSLGCWSLSDMVKELEKRTKDLKSRVEQLSKSPPPLPENLSKK